MIMPRAVDSPRMLTLMISFLLLSLFGTASAGLADGDLCEAATWSSGGGVFNDAKNWKSKKVPKKNAVVVVSAGADKEVEVKEETSVGYLVLVNTNLVLEKKYGCCW